MIKLRPLRSILDLVRESDYEGHHDWYSEMFNEMYDEHENPMYFDDEEDA